MQQQQRQMPTSQLLKRFIPYFYKYRKLLVIDLMAAGLTTVCELVLPMIVLFLFARKQILRGVARGGLKG